MLKASEALERYRNILMGLESRGWRSIRKAVPEPISSRQAKLVADELRTITDPLPEAVDVQDVDDEAPEDEDIEDIIASRMRAAKRKAGKFRQHRRKLRLPAQPVGFWVVGDPHVDNEGCDWERLHDDVELVREHQEAHGGLLGVCVGDVQDNWIGRLQRLYANSSCKASDGWRLSEWLLGRIQWLAVVGGNHDQFANGPGLDPLQRVCEDAGVECYAPDEIRMDISWEGRPDLEHLDWVLRHDAPGRSWFHATHGPNKLAMLDGKVHLVTAGHTHEWGLLATEQTHGRCTTALRVRGYKRSDEYALAGGFTEQQFGESCLIVVQPEVEGPGRITVFWDLEQGLRFLRCVRGE